MAQKALVIGRTILSSTKTHDARSHCSLRKTICPNRRVVNDSFCAGRSFEDCPVLESVSGGANQRLDAALRQRAHRTEHERNHPDALEREHEHLRQTVHLLCGWIRLCPAAVRPEFDD